MKKYEQPICSYCDKKGDKDENLYYKFTKDIRGKEGTFTHLDCLNKVLKSIKQ